MLLIFLCCRINLFFVGMIPNDIDIGQLGRSDREERLCLAGVQSGRLAPAIRIW
jgi:hypothetical protein